MSIETIFFSLRDCCEYLTEGKQSLSAVIAEKTCHDHHQNPSENCEF